MLPKEVPLIVLPLILVWRHVRRGAALQRRFEICGIDPVTLLTGNPLWHTRPTEDFVFTVADGAPFVERVGEQTVALFLISTMVDKVVMPLLLDDDQFVCTAAVNCAKVLQQYKDAAHTAILDEADGFADFRALWLRLQASDREYLLRILTGAHELATRLSAAPPDPLLLSSAREPTGNVTVDDTSGAMKAAPNPHGIAHAISSLTNTAFKAANKNSVLCP